jgi:hypothetical protein
MKFYLNCWVPSKQDYIKIEELNLRQLSILSKYLVNEDEVGINDCFNQIIMDNLEKKELFDTLDRLDKWFILSFLKSNNISPLIIIKAKTAEDKDCTVDFSLIDILTQASEYKFKFNDTLEVKNFAAQFKKPVDLYSKNILIDTVANIRLDNKNIDFNILANTQRATFFNDIDKQLSDLLLAYVGLQDNQNDIYLIKNTNNLKNLFDIKLNLFDNTLFAFLKSIYFPYAQSLYLKKYTLINKIGLSLHEIDGLTPFEADIYMNILSNEEKSLAEKKDGLR